MKKVSLLATHPSELLEVLLDVLEGRRRRQATDEDLLCAGHHLEGQKTGLGTGLTSQLSMMLFN